MNGFLARVASFINALVGLAIITAGAAAAIGLSVSEPSEIPGLFMGLKSSAAGLIVFLMSIIIAALVCGLVAYLSEIERHLREMKMSQTPAAVSSKNKDARVPPTFE